MAFEKTQNKLDELRNLTWQNGKLIEQNQQLLDQLENGAGAIGSEIMVGKQALVDAIEYKGGTSSADKSLQGIAEDIKEISNFNISGFIFDSSIPKNILEVFEKKSKLTTIKNNNVESLNGYDIFSSLDKLTYVEMRNLKYVNGRNTFLLCRNLSSVDFPSLIEVNAIAFLRETGITKIECQNLISVGSDFVYNCHSLKEVVCPALMNIKQTGAFGNLSSITSIILGRLLSVGDMFYNSNTSLRNLSIGQDTDIDLPFQKWTASSVIAEGQSGINELNSNLYNNLLTKLADHSTDGQTRTLRIGWLSYVTQENIDYANSKGWTLTT